MKDLIAEIKALPNKPQHIAIIMDGNGRWAKDQKKARTFGHQQGEKNLRRLARICYDLELPYLSVFAFSTENWQRQQSEVSFLMSLLLHTLKKEIKLFKKENNQVKIKFIGFKDSIDRKIVNLIEQAESLTAQGQKMQINIMFNYGSQQEIIEAIKSIPYNEIKQLTVNNFSQYLKTKDIPNPDLLIRTSGEYRISNFLLWQIAYSELYFSKKYWPEFNEQDLFEAIKDYVKRKRRFGKEK